jgi:hypothetical protein
MKDLEIHFENHPGALAEIGEALAKAGVSVEGGGAWVNGNDGIAHFLFEDILAARRALEIKGIKVMGDHEILIQRLKQDQPGQLGKITRLMAQAGVTIKVLYSDHYNQLILVVDNYKKGLEISENWSKGIYE